MSIPSFVKNDQAIALINFDDNLSSLINHCNFEGRQLLHFDNEIHLIAEWEDKKINVVAVISKSDILGSYGINLIQAIQKKKFPSVPVILIVKHLDDNLRKIALDAGVR